MSGTAGFTSSQIRYLIHLLRLSEGGVGVKNVELSKALTLSKPSVHHMLGVLCERGLVRQEAFGLAHLSGEGRAVAEAYAECLVLLEQGMTSVLGVCEVSESALCGVLADLSEEALTRLRERARQIR